MTASRLRRASVRAASSSHRVSAHGGELLDLRDKAVRSWIVGHVPTARCDRVPLTIRPLDPIPASVAAAKPIAVGGLVGRTLAATIATLREAEASWLTVYPAGWSAGLEHGQLSGDDFDVFHYSAYSDVPGLALSGATFSTSKLGTLVPGSERGIVSVGGTRAASGFLQVRNHRIFGTLGGRTSRFVSEPSRSALPPPPHGRLVDLTIGRPDGAGEKQVGLHH